MYTSDLDLVFVQKRLAEAFTMETLKMLCLMLGIDHENIAGDTLNKKTRELVIYCYKYGLLKELLEQSKTANPSIDWAPAHKTAHRQTEIPEEWAEPLQQLYSMAKDFNRNRALPFSQARTRDGDEIAFRMREAAPFVYGQFDEREWLRSGSIGKRLAAVKYLDWAQNVECYSRLLPMVFLERPFMQFHVLVTLDSMIDQLNPRQRWILKNLLALYRSGRSDSNREFWRQRMLRRLRA